jgi:molybdopterin-guanine dinucleotide biosynthesis protein A
MSPAAVILAGGAGRRLGGVDKPALMVGGRSLLDRVLDAVSGPVVVVGPRRETARPVSWVREDPPGGGPVAALAAALPLVDAATVAVLAADLPFMTAEALQLLETSLSDSGSDGADGALLVDPSGRDQLLAGVWRTSALRRALAAAGPPEGLPLRVVLANLTVVRVPAPAAVRPAWQDCDTPEDLRRAEELA